MSEHIVPVRVYRNDFPGAAGRHRADSSGRVSGLFLPRRQSRTSTQHRDSSDDRGDQSDVRRALLHARALQLTTYLGDCGFRAVLDGDNVRADVQRLLDARLATSRLLTLTYSPRCRRHFPHFNQVACRPGSSDEWLRLTS